MTHVEMPEIVRQKADEVFDNLSDQEREVLRMRSLGYGYDDIGVALDMTESAARSAMHRVTSKKAMPGERLAYLVGVHDARVHARTHGPEAVTIVVSRGSDVRRLDI